MTQNPEAEIRVVEHDPSWPARFEEERAVLACVIDLWVVGPVEHIGSTAVPGLNAKPVIDIMAPVESLDASRPALPVLEKAGYCYAQYRTDVMHWFCKPSPSFRTHHLHLVPFGSRLWIERLAFRDYLRAHRQIASEYAQLKRRLAQQYRLDREAYTDAKSTFINHILKLATEGKYQLDR
jgi:GrpB-like predicted nucleotidyltransferase (UPF0157 family)